MKVNYCSLGCKVNLYETEAVLNEFIDNDFKLVSFNEKADVTIINTCTVTNTADQKTRQMIHKALRNKPKVLAIMGCFVALDYKEIVDQDVTQVIIGTSNRSKLYDYVIKALENKTSFIDIEDPLEIVDYEELKLSRFVDKTRGFVKIQDGCNNFCSYCRIPYARGRSRSRDKDNIIKEIQDLTNNGVYEIVLTGINTASYGEDLENYSFADLLEEIVLKVKGLGRLRISSIEVTEITDEVLKVIKKYPSHFCNHLHIPLQSGSDVVLKEMNRKYDTSYYFQKIQKIREHFPLINITTDLMVGFYNETKEEFEKVKEFIQKVEFGEIHVFPYSRRKGTLAYEAKKDLKGDLKKARVNEVLSINKELALKYQAKYLNQILEIVIEKNEKGICFGHASNYLKVTFKDLQGKVGSVAKVRLVELGYPLGKGEVIEV